MKVKSLREITPSVSVIIPVFNREKYLDEAIQSVLSQTLENIELIIVDDGSTDNSKRIAEKYLAKDSRVQYHYQPNSGVSVARNLGLLNSQGKYVYFLDSDDSIDPEFIESSYNCALDRKADLVVIGSFYETRLPQPTALPTCAQMWRRAFLIENSDVKFPVGIQPGEDGVFSHCLLALTENIEFNPDGVYHYRDHADQNHRKAASQGDQITENLRFYLEVLAGFYDNRKLKNTKSLHLAKFVEHEPFEFRYLKSQLNNFQKQTLMNIVQTFYNKHIAPYLEDSQYNELSVVFRTFLEASNHKDFDRWYAEYKAEKNRRVKRDLFLIKFVPFPSTRRILRDRVRKDKIQ